MIRRTVAVIGSLVITLVASAADRPKGDENGSVQATSLLGRKLYALPDSDGSIAKAKASLAADAKNVTLRLKLARAQAAKRQYREAVITCAEGLKYAPDNADLYLEKGHRELGLREFKQGLADLAQAVRLDPRNLDAQYHLGMANYFLRDFKEAAAGFQRALNLAQNADSVIDCSNWLFVSLQRAGDPQRAANVLNRIGPDVKNTEPHLLFYLRLLRFYQGKLSEQELLPPPPQGPSDIEGELSFNTVNYGVGNWHLYHGDPVTTAEKFFRHAVAGYAWNSWGFIGSELELSGRPR
jgi:tetratricopeptide (TPR) repeat protein